MASLSYLCLRYIQLRTKRGSGRGLTPSEQGEIDRLYTALYERGAFGDR
jgi:hypothetical protein